MNNFAEWDATPDAQDEEIEITKETRLYEVPSSIIKMKECDTMRKQMGVKMEENVSYQLPSQGMKMTECEAYGSLPNKP